MMKKFLFILLIILYSIPGKCETIPSEWTKTIVPIEKKGRDIQKNINYKLHGTGFLIAKQIKDKYYSFLITNRHILENEENIYLKLKKKNTDRFFRFKINLKDKKGNYFWKSHPDKDIDIAACRINLPSGLDVKVLTLDKVKNSDELIEGDRVIFYGFPQIAYENNQNINKPAVRNGIVSLIDKKYYLIDAMVFPGNSGSPVFQPLPDRHQAVLVARPSESYLIGIVAAYKSMLQMREYQGREYVISDNVGLGIVFPAEKIKEVLDLFFGKNEGT